MSVVVTATASRDFVAIAAELSIVSEPHSGRVLQSIDAEILKLASGYTGTPLHVTDAGYRYRTAYGDSLVIYRLVDETPTVFRIIHSSRDLSTWLLPKSP